MSEVTGPFETVWSDPAPGLNAVETEVQTGEVT